MNYPKTCAKKSSTLKGSTMQSCREKCLWRNLAETMGRRWRKQCPSSVRVSQENALSTTNLYMMRQTGPAAYIIRDELIREPIMVRLGDNHTCTCRDFQATREICVHISWVLLKKLRLRCTDPLSYQTGLVARELTQCLNPTYNQLVRKHRRESKRIQATKRTVKEGDTCPICLEEYLVKHLPVVHCKYSCGNPVHVRCMVILSQHQLKERTERQELKNYLICPLCRGDFMTPEEMVTAAAVAAAATRPLLKPEPLASHEGQTCRICMASPVIGNLYRCLACPQVILCAQCLLNGNYRKMHMGHGIAIKKKPNERWRVTRLEDQENQGRSRRNKINQQVDTIQQRRDYQGTKDKTSTSQQVDMALECGSLYKVPTLEQMVEASIILQNNLLFGKGPNIASNIRKVLKRELEVKLPPPEVRVHRVELMERGVDRSDGNKTTEKVVRSHRANCRSRAKNLTPELTKKRKDSPGRVARVDVNDGRSIGCKVQPLLAVLMYPRRNEDGEETEEPQTRTSSRQQNDLEIHHHLDEAQQQSHRSALEMKVARLDGPEDKAKKTSGLEARPWSQQSAKRWGGTRSSSSSS